MRKTEGNQKTEQNEILHVLHVFGKLNRGGAESRVMDLYRNMDRTKVQFDFMQHTDRVCDFQLEIEQLGGKVYQETSGDPDCAWAYDKYGIHLSADCT